MYSCSNPEKHKELDYTLLSQLYTSDQDRWKVTDSKENTIVERSNPIFDYIYTERTFQILDTSTGEHFTATSPRKFVRKEPSL